MREAAQVVSYEVPLGMCAVVPVLIAGSMDLVFIGDRQAGGFWNWYVFHDPFTFVTFWVYFTCATASVNRAPFDLAEAESELVAGFHTEYSGLRWSFFFMAEYGSMMAVGLTFDNGFWFGFAGNVLGAANVIFKGIVGVTVMMWVRWTLPRLRIDQVITTCLKYCVPLAAMAFLGATLWQYWLPNRAFFGMIPLRPQVYALAEDLPEAGAKSADAKPASVVANGHEVDGGKDG
jgi:NADH-quinone oxidoreductase subunit H